MELELETILSDSIYFIIEPDHEMPTVLVTDYKFICFNSSSYNVLFSYSKKMG